MTFLDPFHMFKLVRNTLGDKKSIANGEHKFVLWNYIEQLRKLQEDEGLHVGNRIVHIQFKKINVNLAAVA